MGRGVKYLPCVSELVGVAHFKQKSSPTVHCSYSFRATEPASASCLFVHSLRQDVGRRVDFGIRKPGNPNSTAYWKTGGPLGT